MCYFNLMLTGVKEKDALSLSIGGKTYPVKKHTQKTRRVAAASNRALTLLEESRLKQISYYAEVNTDDLSQNHLYRIQVTSEDSRFQLPVLHHFSYYIPAAYKKNYLNNCRRRDGMGLGLWDAKLSMLGVKRERVLKNRQKEGVMGERDWLLGVNLDLDFVLTPMDIAKSLLFEHPDMANVQPYTAAIVMNEHIAPSREYDPQQYQKLYDFATAISKAGPDGWAYRTYAVNRSTRQPICYEYDVLGHQAGEKVEIYDLSDEILKKAASPLSSALKSACQDPYLQDQTWSINQGQSAKRTDEQVHRSMQKKNAECMQAVGEDGVKWGLKEETALPGLGLDQKSISLQGKNFKMDVTNCYLRTLGAYVSYLDDKGNPLSKEKTFCTIVGPVDTLMGIPIPVRATTVETELPDAAAGLKFYFGGLGGSGYDPEVCEKGIALTAIFQLGIPTFFLAADVGLSTTKVLTDIMKDTERMMSVASLFVEMTQGATEAASTTEVIYEWLEAAGRAIGGLLVSKLMENVLTWIITCFTAEEAAKQIPIAGWALRIAAVVIDVAQLTQTVAETCSSPAVLKVEVNRTMDLEVTVNPDPKHGEAGHPETAVWPAAAENWQLDLTYKGGTNRILTGKFPAVTGRKPIVEQFNEIPAGGSLKAVLSSYSKNGWLCGRWDSGWQKVTPSPESGKMSISGSITELLVPLSCDVQYQYKEKLTYQKGAYQWHAGDKPTETLSELNHGSQGNHLCQLNQITYNSAYKQAGYVWSASGDHLPPVIGSETREIEYMIQNISTLSAEQVNRRLKASEIGFIEQPCVIYDKFGEGKENFILDSRSGVCHLRRIDLMDESHGFGLSDAGGMSYGKFNQSHLDALVIHPDGVAIGVTWKSSKMEFLKIPENPSYDANAVEAQMMSGEGFRQGLLSGPIAVKIAVDGRVLVLESGNRRIQGFDVNGNPVPGFIGKKRFEAALNEVKESLNQGICSDRLQELFRQAGLTELFDMGTDQAEKLDQSVITVNLLNAFRQHGVYLYYQINDLSSSAKIKILKAGSLWKITEPVRGYKYRLELTVNRIVVSRILDNMVVDVEKNSSRWVLHDHDTADSYLAQPEIGNENQVGFYEFLPYMELHAETQQDTYLDFCVESKGYLYVLSYQNDGEDEQDYHMDIYEPDGTFLVRTPDDRLQPKNPQHVNAAKLEVDEFRNMLTLNYEKMSGFNGKVEPSISRWNPTTPLFTLGKEHAEEFEAKNMEKIRSDFTKNHITLGQGATLSVVKAKEYYQIQDRITTENVVYDVILCVDQFQVYRI